jgi:hypothetical protein
MMSCYSISNRVDFRRICLLCTMMACAILFLLPIGASAQIAGDPSAFNPGLHNLELSRADGPAIRYAISIPSTYSPSASVPLILALHFGVGGGEAAGAGAGIVQILIGPAFAGLGAIIVAPDSVGGNWTNPENEKAVNALLDMVLAHYAIDRKGLPSPATAWAVQVPGILRRNSQNASARRFQSPAGRRHPPRGGGFRFWQFIRATTRSPLLTQRRRGLLNFRRRVSRQS